VNPPTPIGILDETVTTMKTTLKDHQGNPLQLVLYKFDSCPFCVYVMRFVEQNRLDVEYRDTRQEPQNRSELIGIGGKSQVPCLLINGEPMYESLDILRYLQNRLVAA